MFAEHVRHDVEPMLVEYVPGLHGVHTACPAESSCPYVPGAQAVHASMLVAPNAPGSVAVPSGQLLHDVAPVMSA